MGTQQQGWGPAPVWGQGFRTPPPPPSAPLKPIPKWIWWTAGCAAVMLLAGATWGSIRLWSLFQAVGREQITLLHQHMKAQQTADIFAEADPAYQRDVGRPLSDEIFQVVRERMGDPESYSVQNVKTSSNTQTGEFKYLVLKTKFSKGYAVETLRYHNVNGTWRMIAYHCNSDLLQGVHLNSKKPQTN